MKKKKIVYQTAYPRIKEIVDMGDLGGTAGTPAILRVTNVDDIFVCLRQKNIREITVSFSEMWEVMKFYLANFNNTSKAQKIVERGELREFMGVKLFLLEESEEYAF